MTSYTLAEKIPEAIADQLSEYDPLVRQVLYNRGITSAEAARAWITPPYDEALHDPFLLNDMEVAVERILHAVAKNEAIVIYSDYDCDGIPGAVVLHDLFAEIGYTNVSVYIPHRHYEGFGFNEEAAAQLAADGAQLIITVDCGVGDTKAVAVAQEAGVDVIVTDHHQAVGELPSAHAVVNPVISERYPFDHLCGAGVAFKLAQALLHQGKFDVLPGREKWWLDMVGIATIADMVSLTGENRTLAHYGLTVLKKSRRPGIKALLKAQRASQQHLTEDDIGFTIGPRINAASRMGEPLRAFKLLTATTEAEAVEHLTHLEQLNNERKGQVAAMTRAAHKKLRQYEAIPNVIVLGDPDWRPSLVGLVANKLAEEHGVPAFIWGRDGKGVLKGSCRSDGTNSVITLMEAATSAFTEFGGHHFSGGFSVSDEAIHTLADALNSALTTITDESDTIEPKAIDSTITSADLHMATLKQVLELGPFGVGNTKPLLQIITTPTRVDVFGKTKEHTKLILPTMSGTMEAIAFFKTPATFGEVLQADQECVCLVEPEQSFFMGRKQLRLRLVDVLATPVTTA